MTISLALATVTNSIAALSISGVTVKDIDEVSAAYTATTSILFPKPDGWITDINIRRASLGTGAGRQLDVSYNLNYRFLYAQLGSQGSITTGISGLVSKVVTIINAILTNDAITGAVEMELNSVSTPGPLPDPAGNMYYGCDFSLHVLELIN